MKLFLTVLTVLLFGSLSNAQEDWTLQRCIDYAFQHNIQIKQAELGIGFSEAAYLQSVGTTLPSLNASGSHGYRWGQTIDPFTNTFATERIQSNSFGVFASMTIFNGFQNMNAVKQSRIDLEASRTDLERVQNDVALNVANSYLNVLFNKEFENIAKANVNRTDQQVKRIADLVQAGALPQGSLSEIQAQLAVDQASLVNAENNLNMSYLFLTQLLQMSEEDARGFEVAQPDLTELENVTLISDPSVAVQHALNNFPQIRSAEAGVASADVGVRVAKGGVSPNLSMSYSYGTGFSGANLQGIGDPIESEVPIGTVLGIDTLVVLSDPQLFYTDFDTKPFRDQLNDNINSSLLFQLNIPIFNGFANKTRVDVARLNLQSAELNLESARQTLRQNVERAYADAVAARNNYDASQVAVRATQTAFEYAEVRYDEGVINSVDYLDARTRLDNAQADLIRNKFDYIFKVKVVDFYLGKAITLR